MDRAGWPCAKDLVVPDNLTLVLLPARAPELNPVENIWQFVRDNGLSRRVFGSYTDRVDHGCYAWNLGVEPPYRPTLDHHVHRPPRLGQCMILNPGWYKLGASRSYELRLISSAWWVWATNGSWSRG
jgi:hypothetical protein